MKFPVTMEEFIAEQEKLTGQKLTAKVSEICFLVAEAANKVYRRTLSGDLKENPFGGDVAQMLSRVSEAHNESKSDDPSAVIAVMEIVQSWTDMAFEQALEDRESEVSA